jgi:hypothetical protein
VLSLHGNKYLSLALLGGETAAAVGLSPARLPDCLTGLASPKVIAKQVFIKVRKFKAGIFDMLQKNAPLCYGCLNRRGQCILFSVVFTPPPPQPPGQVFGSYLISLVLINTVPRCGLAYLYGWRGFLGTKKKTSVGLLLLIPRWF